MKDSYERRLLAADDPVHWECPPSFDWQGELDRLAALRPALESALGFELELDGSVQDAAHFATLFSRTEARSVSGPGTNVVHTNFEIVFSSFGRLFTIWGNAPDRPVDQSDVQTAQQFLEAEGYFFVPVEVLDEPYTGHNSYRDRIPDWWHRFFAHV